MNLKFCTHIHRIDRNKGPLQILGRATMSVLGDSRKFTGAHVWGASRGHLCGGSVFLFRLRFITHPLAGVRWYHNS